MSDVLRLSFVGDLCPINRVEGLFLKKQYPSVYGSVLNEFKDSDYVVANLECPLTNQNNKISKIGPNLKAAPQTIEGIKYGKANILTLANNHMMDYGKEGLIDTLNICKENHIQTVGAGNSINESLQALFIKKGNRTISILNFCEDEFSTTHGDYPGTAPINPLLNLKPIKYAKDNSDYLIIVVHGGTEHFNLPNPFIRQTFQYFAELGADIVVGHHTHCVSGFEKHKKSLLFYSLGNYIFDHQKIKNKSWNTGIILQLSISESISYKIVPFIQNDQNIGLRYLKDDEKSVFLKKLDNINYLIANNELWHNKWDEFVVSRQNDFLSRMLAYNSFSKKTIKYLRLYNLVNKKQKLFLKNYFHCQSHSELLKTLFNV